LLTLLASRAGELVTRAEIQKTLWEEGQGQGGSGRRPGKSQNYRNASPEGVPVYRSGAVGRGDPPGRVYCRASVDP
jgi:hypothetical protein